MSYLLSDDSNYLTDHYPTLLWISFNSLKILFYSFESNRKCLTFCWFEFIFNIFINSNHFSSPRRRLQIFIFIFRIFEEKSGPIWFFNLFFLVKFFSFFKLKGDNSSLFDLFRIFLHWHFSNFFVENQSNWESMYE